MTVLLLLSDDDRDGVLVKMLITKRDEKPTGKSAGPATTSVGNIQVGGR
jgi:hypothetical protein